MIMLYHDICTLLQVGIAAKTVTGQFEVTVEGELVHSKEVLLLQFNEHTVIYSVTEW